jgi:hypothetical protein
LIVEEVLEAAHRWMNGCTYIHMYMEKEEGGLIRAMAEDSIAQHRIVNRIS